MVASGNLSFLNWLTAVPAVFAFDDASLAVFFRPRERRLASCLAAAASATASRTAAAVGTSGETVGFGGAGGSNRGGDDGCGDGGGDCAGDGATTGAGGGCSSSPPSSSPSRSCSLQSSSSSSVSLKEPHYDDNDDEHREEHREHNREHPAFYTTRGTAPAVRNLVVATGNGKEETAAEAMTPAAVATVGTTATTTTTICSDNQQQCGGVWGAEKASRGNKTFLSPGKGESGCGREAFVGRGGWGREFPRWAANGLVVVLVARGSVPVVKNMAGLGGGQVMNSSFDRRVLDVICLWDLVCYCTSKYVVFFACICDGFVCCSGGGRGGIPGVLGRFFVVV